MESSAPLMSSIQENTKTIFLEIDGNNLYQIDFTLNQNKIKINCQNTSTNSNKIYYHELTKADIKPNQKIRDINQIFSKISDNNCSIVQKGDYIILQIYLEMNNFIDLKLEEKNPPVQKVINNSLKILMEELKSLRDEVNLLKKENNKFKLICDYNSIDQNSYKLEYIFIFLKSDIFFDRKDLGLINKTINRIFDKSIQSLNIIFKYTIEDEVPSFDKIISNLRFLLVLIKTKENRRFGVFCNNKSGYKKITNKEEGEEESEEESEKKRDINKIFDFVSYLQCHFFFSLDTSRIYYPHDSNIPYFEILYDDERQCIYGKENKFTNEKSNQYKLSGKNRFNIVNFEIYKIKIGKY